MRWASALLGMLALRVERPRVGKLVRGGMQGGKTVLGSSTGHWADVFSAQGPWCGTLRISWWAHHAADGSRQKKASVGSGT